MKKTIHLNEVQFQNLIKRTVVRILNEDIVKKCEKTDDGTFCEYWFNDTDNGKEVSREEMENRIDADNKIRAKREYNANYYDENYPFPFIDEPQSKEERMSNLNPKQKEELLKIKRKRSEREQPTFDF